MAKIRSSAILFLVIAVLTTSSCTRALLTGSGMRPKNPDYFLSKSEWTGLDTTKIDLNSVYTSNGGFYFRFFGDGTCIYGSLRNLNRSAYDIANDLKGGTSGYYRLDGNKITVELFYSTQGYFYILLEGELRPDNSFEFHSKKYSAKTLGIYRKKFRLNHFDGIYERLPAEDLDGNFNRQKNLKGKTVDWGR